MTSTMEGRTIESISIRRWEDLSTDCLTKVFQKVGLESLILDIPFVCKSWYKASLDPLIYKVLHFEFMPVKERTMWATLKLPDKLLAEENYSKAPPSTEFIKVAVNRSCGMATELVFPEFHNDDKLRFFAKSTLNCVLEYVLERCPALKTLIVPYFRFFMVAEGTDKCLLKMISKFKHLQSLATLTASCYLATNVLNQIHIHCQNFQSLTARGYISKDFTSKIVTLFPNIKHLVLRECQLSRANLISILSGCSKLELLDVTCCTGFDGNDVMILKLASHIKIFKSEGSLLNDSDEEDYVISNVM